VKLRVMDTGDKKVRDMFGLQQDGTERLNAHQDENLPRGSGRNTRGKSTRLLVALLIILAAVAGGIWVYSSGIFRDTPDMLLITSGDKMVIWRPLKDIGDTTFSVEGPLGTTVVEVKQGQVRVLSSPCPEHICMNTGWISKPGGIIVCMPNGIVVRIVKKPT
jgi:hypothetical protein